MDVEVDLDDPGISGILANGNFKEDKVNDIVTVVKNGNTRKDYKVV